MSWMKRPQGAPGAVPATDQQPYSMPQPPYNKQQNAYQHYQPASNTPVQPQQQYWPVQQPGVQPPTGGLQPPPGSLQQPQTSQYGQVYQQPPTNANQYYPQYNQNYINPSYNTDMYYQNQPPQQNPVQSKQSKDGWEDNWDWGWEEGKQQQMLQQQNVQQQHHIQQQNVQQQQVMSNMSSVPQQVTPYNNANVLEESFASNDTSWSWAVEDKNVKNNKPQEPIDNIQPATLPVNTLDNNVGNQFSNQCVANQPPQQPVSEETVKSLNDTDVVRQKMPNLALGKRFNSENLTPQWSIESQMSQDSSDGPQTHSESTYRSENHSRNSNKSSPDLNTENSNFNYSQSGLDELSQMNADWSRHSVEEAGLIDYIAVSHGEVIADVTQEELANTLQELNIANIENPIPESDQHLETMKEQASSAVGPPAPPLNLPPPPLTYPTTSSPLNLPPPNFQAGSLPNPFKHSGGFSHKSIAKSTTTNTSPATQPIIPPAMSSEVSSRPPSASLSSPAVVNKVTHQHASAAHAYHTANLETAPDNSERPDASPFRDVPDAPVPPPAPDNLEVAPRNDRNEYLQTAHLSGGDYGESADFRNVPPPGPRRMGVGRQETEYSRPGDEPPPGLARLVPGRQTEADDPYAADDYRDRLIDGRPTDSGASNPFRQDYGPRMTLGLDRRMVPGEADDGDYRAPPYRSPGYSSNDERVVTGVDHDYVSGAADADVREQNVDGSDYGSPRPLVPPAAPRVPPRAAIDLGAEYPRAAIDMGAEYPRGTSGQPEIEQRREVTVEGENLQDLSVVSSTDLTFSRDQTLEGAAVEIADAPVVKTDASDSADMPAPGSRRTSSNRPNTSGEDSERDRAFKASPRRERHRASKERDRDKERYSRDERKYAGRDEGERRDKRERNRDNPDDRRHRRSARSHRYETEDTDYYSDRERDRRRYREGSYTSSKPPRPDDKERRHRDDRDRNKRYATIERERRYELDERDGATRSRRGERGEREGDDRRYERKYRDIDPTRKYGNIRREEEDRRREEAYSPEWSGERNESERRRRRHRHHDAYYDKYGGYNEAYLAQRQQYEYYERLRLTNPTAYMHLYNKLMAGQPLPPVPVSADALHPTPLYPDGFGTDRDDRGSVHSGRSSANNNTRRYYGDLSSPRTASLRTDLSDRDFNTDASLNLHLEESTVRSERMTPFKYATPHVKGVISSTNMVYVRASYPADGEPAAVQILAMPDVDDFADYPGPLVKGVTHKQSVVEYCRRRACTARAESTRDRVGTALLWELLATMLQHNGLVVGTDMAELLMKSQRECDLNPNHNESDRGSVLSSRSRTPDLEPQSSSTQCDESDPQALDTFRELLLVGNTQQALEIAMKHGLWGHALTLSAGLSQRVRGTVHARFLASLPARDPLATLYAARHLRAPRAAGAISDEKWGDWRPHLAIILANPSSKPETDQKTIIQMGDSLQSRGLHHSAQFCYLSAGVPPAPHPLSPHPPQPAAPPRLSLLLAQPHATSLRQFATNDALIATEVYEYALSLHQDTFIPSFQVFKLVLACRLCDAGRAQLALLATEQVARALSLCAAPPALLRATAALAERLKYHEPVLADEALVENDSGDSTNTSPKHQHWIANLAAAAKATVHTQHTQHVQQNDYNMYNKQDMNYSNDNYMNNDVAMNVTHDVTNMAPVSNMADTSSMADASNNVLLQVSQFTPHYAPDASQQAQQQYQWTAEQQQQQYLQPIPEVPAYAPAPAEADVPRHEPFQPADNYWAGGNSSPYAYTEEVTSNITLPGSAPSTSPALYGNYEDDPPNNSHDDADKKSAPKPSKKEDASKVPDDGRGGAKGSGWLGGILTKLSLRAPNQMILPDDKNPSIVWDADSKRWRNKDGDEEVVAPPPPPPTVGLVDASSGMAPPPPPNSAPGTNIYKMQKGRHIKNSYVDVFNPSGRPAAAAPVPAALLANHMPVQQGEMYGGHPMPSD